MKPAVIFSVPLRMAEGCAWRWRSADHTQGSTQPFEVYADCVADAERNGYVVEVGPVGAPIDVASRVIKKRS